MALKLKGSTSGFVGLDAPSVAGNNTLILPENSGSAFQLFANDITAGVTTFTSVSVNRNGDLTVPGTISIGGTLTYEDVTSVDSVGVVTARGLSIFGNTTGLQVASGISTFVDVSARNVNVTGVSTFASTVDINGDATFGASGSITSNANFALSSNKLRVTGSDTVGIECQRASNATIQCTETTNSTDLQLRANSTGGLVRTATNKPLVLGTYQQERVRITGAGSVGINTDNPNRRFTLYQDTTTRMNLKSLATSTVGIEFGDPDDENIGYIVYDNTDNSMAFGANAGERLRISSNGDVRIGSGAPATFGSGTTVFETYNANTYTANLVTSGTHQLQMIASQTHGATSIGTRSNHNLNLSANDSTKVTITTAGNVGINETAPSEKLQIDGDILLGGQANSGTADYAIKFEYNNHQFAKIVGDGRDSSGYGDIDFYTSTGSGVSNLTQKMTIRSDGRLGLGEASPVNLFTISSASTQDDALGNLQIRYTGSTTTINSGITFKNYSGTSQFMQWDTNGCRIGNRIVTNTGNGHVYITAGTDTVRLSINASTGNFAGSGSADISDGRLKENIASISNATATIKQLLGKTFTWKEEAKLGTDTKYGFIAQELKTVLPDLVYQDVGINRVSKDADKQGYGQGEIVDDYSDDYKDDSKSEWSMAVNTSGVIPILVEAFKELEARIAALEG